MDSQAIATRPSIRGAMLTIAVFAICWTGTLLYWRANGRTPSGRDVGQLLLALPAAILLTLWLAKKSFPARAPASVAAAGDAAQAAEQRAALPCIAAGAVRLRGGSSLGELADTLASHSAQCELDPELTDDAGYPVLSGRVDSLDPSAQQEAMSAWLAPRDLVFSEEQWRALALGSAVAAELLQHALRAGADLPTLHLRVILPPEWQDAQRRAAADWFVHLAGQQGWPAQRLLLLASSAPFALVDAISTGSDRGLVLLVACASQIGEDTVRDWAGRGILFSGRTPRGQVPGEGAAGLLLADAGQAALLDQGSLARLAAARSGLRPTSADAPGNISHELLSSLAKEALTEPAAVAAISADADLRPSRIGELMGMAHTLLPHLDLSTAMMSVGTCCGSAGAVGPIAALALAGHQALAGAGPVLCVSNADPHYRCAVVVSAA